MDTYSWYSTLIKPSWAPPAEVFGPVWFVLYSIIIVSFGFVFYKAWKREVPRGIACIFFLNIVFNLAFSPLQFTLQNNILASIDIVLIFVTLVWALASIYKHVKWVALVNIPYLLWVSFATVLQLTITWLNQ